MSAHRCQVLQCHVSLQCSGGLCMGGEGSCSNRLHWESMDFASESTHTHTHTQSVHLSVSLSLCFSVSTLSLPLPLPKLHTSPASPPPHLLDTLGAGDTFNAGFIHKISTGHTLQQALSFACLLAGTKCGIAGFDGLKCFRSTKN